jgi:hypothetical protein
MKKRGLRVGLFLIHMVSFSRLFKNILIMSSNVLQIVVCPFVIFLLTIVLSVLLRFTDSDYPFGIFKLFLIPFKYFLSLTNLIIAYDSYDVIS